ncbi:GntR family transcriptional regulator [Rhodococcus sp. ACT016]|uniref:GntR family transcriptional regulator n=1 Tax=Rhodococcus sp. ACT016 TaxID=3134808 RepID=UPI003D280287
MYDVPAESTSGGLEELAYQRLKEALLVGTYGQGDRLSIRGVSDSLDLSPMPCRAAIRRLVHENALDTTRAGTAIVPHLTRRGFEDLTLMRIRLEPLALQLGAPNLTTESFERLGTLVRDHDIARLASDTLGAQQADTAFLFEIYRAAASPLLLRYIEGLWLRRSPLFWEARWIVMGSSVGRVLRHQEIVDALHAADVEVACELLTEEIRATADLLLAEFDFRS